MLEKHVAIYRRVSTEEQADNPEKSLKSQEQRCREYWKKKNPESTLLIIVYTDIITGSTEDRDGYQALLDNINLGLVVAVIATDIERVMRAVIQFGQFLELCETKQVKLHFLRQDYDGSTNLGWMMLMIGATMAQYERKNIRERITLNASARARRGLWTGGTIFGYKPKFKSPGYLDIVEEQAIIIRQLFEKFLELGSYSKVASWATQERLKSKCGYIWKATTVFWILRNPAYIGKRRAQDKLISAVWEPIISEELWEKVNQKLDENYEAKHNTIMPSGHVWIFSGKLFCPHCNVKLQNAAGTSKTGDIHHYYRHSRFTRKDDCPLIPYISAPQFDESLTDSIFRVVMNSQIIDEVVQKAYQSQSNNLNKLRAHLNRLTRDLQILTKTSETLVSQLALLPSEQIQEFVSPRLQKISEEKKSLSEKISDIQQEIYQTESKIYTPEQIYDLAAPFVSSFAAFDCYQQKKAIQLMVDKVDLTTNGIAVYLKNEETKKAAISTAMGSSVFSMVPRTKHYTNPPLMVFILKNLSILR